MNTNGMMRTILRFTAGDEQMCVLCAQKEFYGNTGKIFFLTTNPGKTFLTCHCSITSSLQSHIHTHNSPLYCIYVIGFL